MSRIFDKRYLLLSVNPTSTQAPVLIVEFHRIVQHAVAMLSRYPINLDNRVHIALRKKRSLAEVHLTQGTKAPSPLAQT